MPDTIATTNSNENEAEKLARLLELELMQKRAAWKQAATHYRTIRLFGFLFIFILIVACAGAFFFVFLRVKEERPNQHDPAATMP